MAPKYYILILGLAVAHIAAAADLYPITGVPVSSRAERVPLRKNINDLQAIGGAQWFEFLYIIPVIIGFHLKAHMMVIKKNLRDLYIGALKVMQDKKASDPLSYFQMMGMHLVHI